MTPGGRQRLFTCLLLCLHAFARHSFPPAPSGAEQSSASLASALVQTPLCGLSMKKSSLPTRASPSTFSLNPTLVRSTPPAPEVLPPAHLESHPFMLQHQSVIFEEEGRRRGIIVTDNPRWKHYFRWRLRWAAAGVAPLRPLSPLVVFRGRQVLA